MDGATVKLLTNLAPELMDGIVARAMALERISVLQPVGRRALAQRMRMPEREARGADPTRFARAAGLRFPRRAWF